MQVIRRTLPQGGTLSDESWAARHRGILGLLWVHGLVVPVYGVIRGLPAAHLVVESLVLPLSAIIAGSPRLARRMRTLVAAVGLLTASGVLVHLSGGVIEMHFHFFVMVAVVSLYQDWVPFLTAIGYVLVHHGFVGALDPRSVYNHPAAIADPWKWAAIHAFFIAGISVASLIAWRLNETLLTQRRRAEANLRDEARVARNLSEVAAMLATDRDVEQVAKHVIEAATARTSGEFGVFFYDVLDETGKTRLVHALAGAHADVFARFASPRNTEIFGPTSTDARVVRLDDVTQDPRYGRNPPYNGVPEGHPPVRSYLAVPVRSRGEMIGGLFFGHTEPARFTEADERIAVGIASHAAVAVENAKLYEAERKMRAQEEQARKRLAIIAEASTQLSTSLELNAILQNLADLLVPAIADNCVIDFVTDDGSLRRVHLAMEPRAAEAYAALGAEPPGPRVEEHPAVRVVETGRSVLIEDIPDDVIERVIDNAELREITKQLRPRSAAIVPIPGSEGTIGALTLATTATSGRRLGAEDVKLLEELARRTATALENARRFEFQREAAQTLQHSLLPARLPDLPAVGFAARYLPGKGGADVGGDWYDVVAVPYGGIGLVMGDVVGRGISAASLMGQIRNALRAYAFEESDPAVVLGRLNALFTGWSAIDQMATLLYAVFDIETGQLRIASAGHPPPVIRKSDGSSALLEHVRGTPLGATTGASYVTHTVELDADDVLLLYTDGLVEDRSTPLDTGIAALRTAVSGRVGDLDQFCARLVDLTLAGRSVDDDVALLAMRYAPFADEVHLTLPTDPWILRPLRSAMRRWLVEAGATPDEAYHLLVATTEACANAIRHPGGPRLRRFELNATRNGRIQIEVRDRGRWRTSKIKGSGGRGLKLIDELVDDVKITKGPPETIVSISHRLANQGEGQ